MVEEDMGVGIVPLQTVSEAVEKGRLVRWWIEGAQINWELGVARLTGGYESPIMQTFIKQARNFFSAAAPATPARPGTGKKRAQQSSKK